jgi:hypothetical protein
LEIMSGSYEIIGRAREEALCPSCSIILNHFWCRNYSAEYKTRILANAIDFVVAGDI